jgi:hypothetical protein
MIIKLKIYGDNVTIKDDKAYSDNQLLEEMCNFISDTIGLGGATNEGYLPTLRETFGNNFTLIEVENEPKDVIY